MTHRAWLVFSTVVWLSLPWSAAGQVDESDSDLPSRVARLVRQLDDDRRSRREEAELALVSLGPDALSHFPAVTARTPAEVKERLGRVRDLLERELAGRAAEPSRVTLSGEMSLPQAFEAIQQQTGNRIVGYQQRGGRVEVAFQETPFWEAVDFLLDSGDLRINAYGGETNALVVEARPPQERPRSERAHYAGVFRFEPIRLEARRDLKNPSINVLRATIEVTWEPRVHPISLSQPLDQIDAVDESGQALTVDTQRGSLTTSADAGISAVELTIPLELPQRGSDRIASLKGTLNAVIPGSQAVFEFDDLVASRDVEQQRAGVTVIYERLRRNLDLYEIRVRVRFDDAGESLQSHRGWVFNNEAYLRTADGGRIENVGLQTTRQDPAEVGVAYLFPLPEGPDGCTFFYESPATILRLPVDFELRDIPLP